MMDINDIKEKMSGRKPGVIGDRKEFAVLIPLVEREDGLHLLFEKRSGNIKQPGDICFPGGRIEEGESITECALRETAEEIGITDVEVIGQFDSILEVNRITMHTVVGKITEDSIKNARLNPDEVADIFTVPLDFFASAEPMSHTVRIIQDTADFPYEETGIRKDYKWRVGHQEIFIYHYEDRIIWGLTARIARWFADFACSSL
ncbi:MAG: NUDIX hydrolase [Anaerovoracaceae bacterium]